MHDERYPDLVRDPDFASSFGARLREEREGRNLSQRKLAEELVRFGVKIDPSAIARIESGARDVKLREAAAIARAMHMMVDDFVPTNSEVDSWERFERTRSAAFQHAHKARSHLAEMAFYFRRCADFIDLCPEVWCDHAGPCDDPRCTSRNFLETYMSDFPEIEPEAVLNVDVTTRDLLNKIAVAAVQRIVEREAEYDPATQSTRSWN